MLVHIGACRPVWVPGQDLATVHLMHNCGTYFVTTLCTICTSVRGAYVGLEGMLRVFMSSPCDKSTHALK